ncbi:DUF4190 domain-containing protein [Hyalangium versicolor]|uniref:DUF4190 domain-containing protein n=1 Tax=Hyalangium versicolor TaxID=2861190 RepID=UPI001CCFD692|nr:DUF4190 domain-containing protein [Hyalangium versicolor]
MSTVDVPLGPIAARCATHPEEAASGTCSRCGTFFCDGCVKRVFDKEWCSACAARPEVNYLERLRLKLWGRRDSAAWMFGAFSLVLAAFTIRALLLRRLFWPLTLLMGACAVVSMAFFLGKRWARESLIVTTLSCGGAFLMRGLQGPAFVFLISGFSATLFYFNTRNRLFFQQPVSTLRLQRLWHAIENNPLARSAMNLGLASVLFPLFAPFAVIFGVVGLMRVNPQATPPIGRKGQAIAGLVLGLLMTALWGLFVWTFIAANVDKDS